MSYAIALVSSFISFLCFFLCCTAIDTLTPTQPIKDGQTLISANKYFELGFFSPGLSKNRYIGIWFHNISTQTVVWVANSEHPVTDSSGVLSINSDGNLVILDGRGRPVWSSIAFIILKNTTATLLESGNLVLRESGSDGNNNYLWQSFNHPTDSLLPTMELTVNRRTGEKKDVTSWRSKDDPAPGNYVFGLEAQVIPQLFVWNGSTPYWRSGQWNGRIFVGIPNMFNAYINGPTLVEKNGIVYFAHSYNTEEYSRIWLDWKGMLSQEIWNEKTKEWHSTWVHSHNPCHLYNTCGPFGICKERESSICSCMRGFKPKFADEWRKGNWTGGCVRRVELNCDGHGSGPADKAGRGDGFLKFEGVKMPDFVGLVHNVDADMCEDECLNNCSCVAYAHVRGIGCMIWSGDLIDIQEFVDGGEDLHIRLADSELGRKGSVKPLIIASSVFGAVIMACCAFIICRRMARKRENSRDSSDVSMLHDGRKQSNGLKFPMFDFNQIVAATRNFDQTNKIGEGGFGPVYKGLLPEGQEVAVKRLSKFSGQGLEEFKNEIMLISELQHRNLVRLLGCCIEGDEKLLVYEYMPNKSLDAFLFDPKRKVMLDWGRRFHIVGEIARGILYLHRDSRLRIIHRDLKASNILLDAELNPKISDFGMARIFGHNQILARTNRVVGTYGYMSPEYAMGGRFSEKSDVFSFGVLLLEIVSGKRSTGFYEPEHSSSLLGCVWRLWNEGNLLKIIDHALGDSFSEAEVQRCIHVALLCVQESAADRPTMLSVIFMLGSDTATLPIPKQPAFTESSSAAETDLLRKNREICSVNEVTTTMLHGR